MASRRFAQANNVASTASPVAIPPNSYAAPASLPSTPINRRTRPSINGTLRSPAATPSISSSVPFDWDAARSMKPPPFGSPARNRILKGRKVGAPGTPSKRIIKKRGLLEKITDIPAQLLLDFPQNLPLPPPKTSAYILGSFLHFVHLCTRFSQPKRVPDSDLGWEDMYREQEGASWFDWTVPVTLLLISVSVLNSLYLATRIKVYRLNRRADLVCSPNASFVRTDLDTSPPPPPPSPSILMRLWNFFVLCWCWLLNLSTPSLDENGMDDSRLFSMQQLHVWAPGELEINVFCLYSPAHAFLWIAASPTNWIWMMIIMAFVTAQALYLVRSYTTLLKDKEIVAAEVMHEYNIGFVYPKLNPIRKDVAVMTHEAEVIDFRPSMRYY